MRCPFCQKDDDKVVDSRSVDEGFFIRRRRHCMDCGKRFTTQERVVEMEVRVLKKNGEKQPFNPEKIRLGLERACWKRPIPNEQVENVYMEIVQEIYLRPVAEIPSQTIGELVMEKLIDLDDVAYIRFASVYRQFKDIHDFVEEVQPILEKKHSERNGKAATVARKSKTQRQPDA